MLIALLVATSAALAAAPARAIPTAPYNIIVFPERDMVAAENFAPGSTVNVNVYYPGAITPYASARGVPVGADGVAEVNHPGGACWGGRFTPDLRPGQRVEVTGGGAPRAQSTRVLNVTANKAVAQGAKQMVVTGIKSASIPLGRMEQRMIEPALVQTAVGRRDVRAPARPGPYTARLVHTNAAGTRWMATYTFDDPAVRNVALRGQTRVLAWEAVVADERQGLTIYEEDEVNGPGMSGCPPAQIVAAPDAPPTIVGSPTSPGPGLARVSWTAATVSPGDGPVVGYRIFARTMSADGTTTTVVIKDVANPAARAATVSGLTSGGTYRLRVAARYTTPEGATRIGPASPPSAPVTVR